MLSQFYSFFNSFNGKDECFIFKVGHVKDVMLLKSLAIPFLLTMLCLPSNECLSQVLNGEAEAFEMAEKSDRNVLLVFAGSDWCAACMHFEKAVLSEAEFQRFSGEHLVVLKADFPQRKVLTAAQREENNRLAERYNPNGIFPYILLLRPQKTVIASLSYNNQSSAEFIDEIKRHLSP